MAVSAGADSVGLLRLLLELREEIGAVLSLAHVNHKLRGEESDQDANFVANLAERYGLEFHRHVAPVAAPNLEAAAREARYSFFSDLIHSGRVSKVATAHTRDDQAETVLLRIFRGTGIRGLAAIHPRVAVEEKGRSIGEIIRPLLTFPRSEMKQFLAERGQSWREDSSNSSLNFNRNRVRHRLLPIIESEFGTAAIAHMADLAEIARAEEEHWALVHPEMRPAYHTDLAVDFLLRLPEAGQRRLMRHWLKLGAPDADISFQRIEKCLNLVRGRKTTTLQISAGWILHRDQSRLCLRPRVAASADGYRRELLVPGTVTIPEIRATFEAVAVDVKTVEESMRPRLLSIEKMPQKVLLRNWRAGDRYWPATHSSPKKIKKILTDRKIKGPCKRLWPVAESESDGIIWMRGFAVPASLQVPQDATTAIWIREFPVSD